MTVSSLNENKICVKLSNIEVLSCFGTYEKLLEMSTFTKTAIAALLRDIIANKWRNYCNMKIQIKIKAKRYSGCEITVFSPNTSAFKNVIFEFDNLENLTFAILNIYSTFKNSKSSLFKFKNTYRLIINNCPLKTYYILNDFGRLCTPFSIEYARTVEYGKPLIERNAVHIYGKSFKVL